MHETFICFWWILDNLNFYYVQIGPPYLCLKWGDFNFAGSHAWEVGVPPTWNFEVDDFNFACMPACKVEVWGIHAGPTQLYLLSRYELWLLLSDVVNVPGLLLQ